MVQPRHLHAAVPPSGASACIEADEAAIAHCIRPVAHTVASPASCAAPAWPSLASVLLQWESASAARSAPTLRDREWLQRCCGGLLSAHAIEVVLQLSHAVSRNRLEQDFDWEVVAQQDYALTLKATPRDEAVRLFCRELQVELVREVGLPRRIQIVSRGGDAPRVISAHQTPASEGDSLAADGLPPSPRLAATPIPFASGSVELEFDRPR
jgi:hypothetical protein